MNLEHIAKKQTEQLESLISWTARNITCVWPQNWFKPKNAFERLLLITFWGPANLVACVVAACWIIITFVTVCILAIAVGLLCAAQYIWTGKNIMG
jgi:hypothetical protein